MTTPVFQNYCIDWAYVLSDANIDKMQKRVIEQARTEEAKRRVDLANYKEAYEDNDFAPMYFGSFVEWYAQHFLNHFGHEWNLHSAKMLDCEGGTQSDLGVDGIAMSIKERANKRSLVSPKTNSKVYIQVKGCMDPTKVHKANDGTRLPNFMTNAMSQAIANGEAYQARYVLFTTGDSIHYTLEQMANGLMEVINIKKIRKWTKGNYHFLNILREEVGLPALEVPVEMDEEAIRNSKNLAVEEMA